MVRPRVTFGLPTWAWTNVTHIIVLLSFFCGPAFAWEFDMKGEYEYRLRYFGRLGDRDLYGKASFQDTGAGTFIGFAGPNIYGTGNIAPVVADASNTALGGFYRITRGGFSRWGSDASYNDSRLTLYPTVRFNSAIRVHGAYTIGGVRNKYRQTQADNFGNAVAAAPLERYYMSRTSVNAYDGTFGTWEQFRATVTIPWATVSIGMKDFPLGTGATLGYNTRSESVLAVVPYGPFRLMYSVWLGRGRYLESWATIPDGDTKPEWFQSFIFTFDNSDVSAGAGWIGRHDHRTRGAVPAVANFGTPAAPFNVGATTQTAQDDNTNMWLVFGKYSNGTVFANAEYAWTTIDRYFPVAGPAPVGGVDQHFEAYHFFSEAGLLIGPAKFSFMYAVASGQVLNNANPSKIYLPWPINYQAMEPYESLMFNTYGGGNQGGWNASDVTFVQDDHGMMTDAYAFGARIDYAWASNLNLWGSCIWAHRLERAGFLNGGIQDVGNGAAGGVAPGTLLGLYGGRTPYCPDGFIGWEADAGINWKLLEGLTLNLRYALFQPGDWFTYAYQALIPEGPGPGSTGVMHGRDPINGVYASLLADF